MKRFCLPKCRPAAISYNGLGLTQAGHWKTPLSTRTQTLLEDKCTLFCPTKQRASARPFVPRAKKLGKAPLVATALCYKYVRHTQYLSVSACLIVILIRIKINCHLSICQNIFKVQFCLSVKCINIVVI